MAAMMGSHGDDDLASCLTVVDVLDGGRGLVQRVRPVDRRGDLSRLDEVSECCQVFGILMGDEGAELLAHQLRHQDGSDLAVAASQPASIGLASDDDEPSPVGESSTEK